MDIEKCISSGDKKIITPPKIDDCTFVQIDSWNPDEHAKSCDTFFIMSDGSGAYFWNGTKWEFLKFGQASNITQIRTTIGVAGVTDSEIFNPSVIPKADLLWTKYILQEGNLVLVTGEFQVGVNQDTSYKNLFWTTPKGFELFNVPVVEGQFVDIVQFHPIENASLNAITKIADVTGWSNFGTISAGYYQLNKTLRAI